jgi:large subunit ribosomal protein L21
MYAIFESSGTQIKVAQGDEVTIDLVEGGEGATGKQITFDKVLLVGAVGGSAKVGTPYVAGAKVMAELIEPLVMGEKLYIQKHRPKTTYKRRTGHRQRFSKIKITSIVG